MPRSEQEHREEIVRVGRLMFDKGWIAANDGNITVRLDNGHLLATPRGVSKGMLKPEDLVVVDMDGNKISGPLEVTTEIGMHLTIYRERPDVNAVVHAHPPAATGFAVAGRARANQELGQPGLEQKRVPKGRQIPPGADEGVLDRVLGPTEITQDAIGDRKQPIAGHDHETGERIFITLDGELDERRLHGGPFEPPLGGTLHPRWDPEASNGSKMAHVSADVPSRSSCRCRGARGPGAATLSPDGVERAHRLVSARPRTGKATIPKTSAPRR